MNSFDRIVEALRKQGLNSDQILATLSDLFKEVTQGTNGSQIGKTYEQQIGDVLKKAGMPTGIKGYKYWIEAIKIYKQNDGKIHLKDIYPRVSEIFGTSEGKIKSAMDFALSEARPILKASGEFPKKITNTNFLFAMAEKVE